MKQFSSIFIVLTAVLLAPLFASAQMESNVAWRMTAKMTDSSHGIITLKASIAPGWHLYGTSLAKGGPQPTVIDFSESRGIKLIGALAVSPKVTTGHDNLFNMTLAWWSGDVVWRQKFKVTDAASKEAVCKVRYNTCNNITCSMPRTETLRRKIK